MLQQILKQYSRKQSNNYPSESSVSALLNTQIHALVNSLIHMIRRMSTVAPARVNIIIDDPRTTQGHTPMNALVSTEVDALMTTQMYNSV